MPEFLGRSGRASEPDSSGNVDIAAKRDRRISWRAPDSRPHLQMKRGGKKAETKKGKDAEDVKDDGQTVAYHMGLILGPFHYDKEMLDSQPPRFKAALRDLARLAYGYNRDHTQIPGREKRAMFGPMVPLEDRGLHLKEHWEELRDSVLAAEARDRVKNTMMVDAGGKRQAIEFPDDLHPKQQAEALSVLVPKLLNVASDTFERAGTLTDAMHGAMHGDTHVIHTVERLEIAARALKIAFNLAKLNDPEFIEKVQKGEIASISELVKTVLEFSGTTLQLTMELGSFLMKRVGDKAMAEACIQASKHLDSIGRLVAGIEIVHGLIVLLDSSNGFDERLEGAVEATVGAIVAGTGKQLWAPAAFGPYVLAATSGYMYREAMVGFEAGMLSELFSWMAEQGTWLARQIELLAAAGQLAATEQDPIAKAKLNGEEKRLADILARGVEGFLERCTTGPDAHHGIGSDANTNLSHYPGNYGPVAAVFAPALAMRGATGPAAAEAAAKILNGIRWCFKHANSLVVGMAKHMTLEEIKEAEDKEREANARKLAANGNPKVFGPVRFPDTVNMGPRRGPPSSR
jgi:hypothetical protein